MAPRLHNSTLTAVLVALVVCGMLVSLFSRNLSTPQKIVSSYDSGVSYILDESQIITPNTSSSSTRSQPAAVMNTHMGDNSTDLDESYDITYSKVQSTITVTTADYNSNSDVKSLNYNDSYMFGHWKLDESRKYQYWLDSDIDLPYDKVLITKQQQQRHSRISQMCGNLTTRPDPPTLAGRRSNIVTLNHILYCPILKAGSTSMLRLLCWLVGSKCSSIPRLHPHNDVPKYLHKGGKIALGNTPEFKSYFSFAIVRNPWKRLVSVYIQKFIETHQGLGFCNFKYRFPAVFRRMRMRENYELTFKQYIEMCVIGQYLDAGGSIEGQNGHWKPQYYMCSFCYLDYTFIGKMETMSSDERVILNAMGFEDVDATIKQAHGKLLPNEKAHSTNLYYDNLWGSIEPDTIEVLTHIYQTDIDLFHYPDHPLK